MHTWWHAFITSQLTISKPQTRKVKFIIIYNTAKTVNLKWPLVQTTAVQVGSIWLMKYKTQ